MLKIVREKYEQNVHTGHMNEADFWRTFFQSHYFTMDRMHPSHTRDLFADCVKRDDESMKSTKILFCLIFIINIEMHDEAERASRKAMAVIAPETNETSEVRIKKK
jgi:hypothetical protein